jgi:hypothetical protein
MNLTAVQSRTNPMNYFKGNTLIQEWNAIYIIVNCNKRRRNEAVKFIGMSYFSLSASVKIQRLYCWFISFRIVFLSIGLKALPK